MAAVAGNLVRYGSAKETEITTSTYNPFADLKARMNDKKYTSGNALNMNTALILWGLLFSSIGFVYFVYGKKRDNLVIRYTGVALIFFPYFFNNTVILVVVGLALMSLPKVVSRYY